MTVFVNGKPADLLTGMSVRHALIQLGLLEDIQESLPQVYDEWGNPLGLDGAIHEGMRIFVDQAQPLEGPGK